jgi:CARDB
MARLSAAILPLALGALLLVSGGAASGAPPRVQLRAFVCHRALDPPNRSISVTATMRPAPGTRHLSLKFELLSRGAGGAAEKVVRAGDLGVWIAPQNPTLGQLPGDVWNLQKSVVELAAPDVYRFRVAFRWTGAGGRVLGSAVRSSRRCLQQELRPDLLVRSIAVTAVPARPNKDLYTAVIANAGNTGAGPFDILFAPADGSAPKTHTVAHLRPHSSRRESFLGPLCTAASDPTITVDSASQIDDLNRANNALTATCPA